MSRKNDSIDISQGSNTAFSVGLKIDYSYNGKTQEPTGPPDDFH